GPHPLLDDAVRFVSERVLADGPNLMPAYTVTGQAVPEQRSLDLPGYPGGTDVLGNQVRSQFQLDAFGEALLLLAAAGRHDRLDAEHYRAVTTLVAAIEQRWHEPGAGLWELDERRWTHSRLICAAGLRAMAAAGAAVSDAAAWNTLADRPRRRPGRRRPAARADPRCPAGRRPAVSRDVGRRPRGAGRRGLRLPVPARRPAARRGRGRVLLCGFVMALGSHQQGDTLSAARWFERNRAACGPPGLFSEEFDVGQRQLRGNLPQAFVHALLLESAVRLAAPWPGPKGS
ncbi:MAG: glycoside hydrolase family 15 protein, partial [Pseudonocardia sp.]|nr:glycoside hydrolase family 15 protein [Pseudonocardia sp.]